MDALWKNFVLHFPSFSQQFLYFCFQISSPYCSLRSISFRRCFSYALSSLEKPWVMLACWTSFILWSNCRIPPFFYSRMWIKLKSPPRIQGHGPTTIFRLNNEYKKDFLWLAIEGPYTLERKPQILIPAMWKKDERVKWVAIKPERQTL